MPNEPEQNTNPLETIACDNSGFDPGALGLRTERLAMMKIGMMIMMIATEIARKVKRRRRGTAELKWTTHQGGAYLLLSRARSLQSWRFQRKVRFT